MLQVFKFVIYVFKKRKKEYEINQNNKKDSLGGNSHSLMVANIAPSIQYHLNTCNTLNFASKSRKIVNRPLINEQTGNIFLFIYLFILPKF
mgnify:CR=1 FL=1